MKKLDSFIIRRLTLSGFKCFAEEQSFDLGETTNVTGGNGVGKSSIADAIAWAVTGAPFFGGHSCDRLHNPECPVMNVTMEFTDEAGEKHTLTRSRKNSKMTITLDGYPVRQTDLNGIFGEKDVFLSIFNPLYFIEVLEENGKALLEKLLPAIPHERVLETLSEQTRTLLKDEKLSSPETYLQNRRAEIRELEETFAYLQGQEDLLQTQREEKQRLLEDYTRQAKEQSLTADTSIAQEIKALETRLDARKAEQYKSQTAQSIMEMRAELKALYDGHARFTKLRQEGKCPTCLQKTGQSEAITATLSDIVVKGKELKGQLSEAEGMDAQAKAVFEQFQSDDVAKMETELAALRERYDKGQRLLDAIEEIQVWLSQNAAPEKSKSNAVQEAIQAKKALCTAAADYISKRAELTFADLKMFRVSISLYDVVKTTGEMKDTFKFTYEGRSYRWLSLSEKLRAGLEVSELLKKLTGSRYPTFMDNLESVSIIDNVRPVGQLLFAMVFHSEPLNVHAKESVQAKSAA